MPYPPAWHCRDLSPSPGLHTSPCSLANKDLSIQQHFPAYYPTSKYEFCSQKSQGNPVVVSWPKNDPASSKFSGFVLSSGHPRQCLTESAEQAALAMPHPAGAEEEARGGRQSQPQPCLHTRPGRFLWTFSAGHSFNDAQKGEHNVDSLPNKLSGQGGTRILGNEDGIMLHQRRS